MSRKGATGPLRLNPGDAAIAAAVIEERTEGVDLEHTPFVALPAFGRKLGKAVRRRRKNATEIVMWTVDRNEAEAGYAYLMLFSHEDVPPDFLPLKEMDAVHNVALDILSLLWGRKGAKELSADEMDARIRDRNDTGASDERWIRRLKLRYDKETAFWKSANDYRRAPIPPSVRAVLAPRKTTPKTTGD